MMKTTILSVWSFLTLTATSLYGQVATVSGMELEIGAPGQNQVNDPFLSSDEIYVYGGAAIGWGNWVDCFDGASLAVGFQNSIYAYGSSAFGSQNSLYGHSSVAIGSSNSISGGSGNLAIGRFNSIATDGSANFVSGSNNVIGLSLDSTAILGTGLYNASWNNATIVGSYNAEPLISAPLRFAVGTGISSASRSNALEVYSNGKVIIRRAQGDILMGEFGN